MTTWNQKSQRTSSWDTERWLSMMVYYNYFAYTYDDTITYDLDFIPIYTPYTGKSQRTTKWS